MDDAKETETTGTDAAPAPSSAPASPAAAGAISVDADGTVRAPDGAAIKAIEVWAAEKKMLPMLIGGTEARVPPGAPALGGVARVAMSGLTGPKVNPEYVRFARAKAFRSWPESKEVTEAAFDAAVTEAETHVCR